MRLHRENRLSVEDSQLINRQDFSPLDYAHCRNDVPHCIKADYIHLSTSVHAFVADCGVASALDEGRSAAHADPGFAVGTLAYMSPEEMNGERGLDGRADLYLLASVMYEMLIGSPPFFGPSVQGRTAIPSVLTR